MLIGHNASCFDTPRLLRQLSTYEPAMSRSMNKPLFFGGSLPFVRKQPWLPKSKALGAIFQHVTGRSFNAHDALEDSKALQDIMLDSRLEQSLAATRESAVHILDAVKDLENKDDIFQR